MSWDLMPLGSLLEPSGNNRAGKGEFPVLSITMNKGLVDQTDKFKKRIASQDTSNYRVVYKNELVVGFPIDEGVLGFQTKYSAGIVSPAYDIWRLKDESISHIPYLERFLRSPQARRLYSSKMQGAVARRRSLTKADFLKLEIPFPPFKDQIRIANLLNKAEDLKVQRKQNLTLLDDLLNSVFFEMFGDPMSNNKGWEKKSCKIVADILTGYPFKSDLYTDDETQTKLCGGLIIDPARIEWEKCNYWPQENAHGLDKYLLEYGDVVLAMDRPWISSGLKIGIVDERGIGSLLVQRTARLRAKGMEQLFLYQHLKNASFTKHCKPTETTVPHISIKDIQTFQVICPPLDLQKQFAVIVGQVEGIKSQYQNTLVELDKLYSSLSQKLFKGELDLSRVVVTLEQEESTEEFEKEIDTVTKIPVKPAIELPTPANISDLSDVKGRMEVIGFWLDSYLEQLRDVPFSAQNFMERAQQKLWELLEDDAYQLSASEYEHVKDMIFKYIEGGGLAQCYDDDKNLVQITAARG